MAQIKGMAQLMDRFLGNPLNDARHSDGFRGCHQPGRGDDCGFSSQLGFSVHMGGEWG